MASQATLTGSQTIYDGKKTLTIGQGTSNIDVSALSASDFTTTVKSGKEIVEQTAESKQVDPAKFTVVSVGGGNNGAVRMTGGTKASTLILGKGGGALTGGSTGADKLYGSTGNDTFTFAVGGGNDQIGDAKTTAYNYNKGDKIVIEGSVSPSDLSFTDNAKKKNVVINIGKQKLTVNKTGVDVPIEIQTSGGSITYGTDGTTSTFDEKKNLTIKSGSGTVSAAELAASAKNINATAVTSRIFLVGNGQTNNISLGAAGGTISGGYNAEKGKATNDNLYAAANHTQPVTFYIGANAGTDNIYNYKEGDVIYIADGTTDIDFTDKKAFKDGGTGKDIKIKTSGGSTVNIKANTANKVTFNIGGTVKTYGVDLPDNVSLDSKRSSMVIGANALSTTYSIENDALKTFAPKLTTIDASAAKNNVTLKGFDDAASVFKGGTKSTTYIGGSKNDQYNGGSGVDIFRFDASSLEAIGKDVINDYGAGDIIMLNGISAANASLVAVDNKGAVTLFEDTKSSTAKNNSITVKNFKKLTNGYVVVTDGSGKVLAVNSKEGPALPTGVTYKSSKLSTSNAYTGKFTNNDYVVGGYVNLDTGKPQDSASIFDGINATINAADYGGNVKEINASVVGAGVQTLLIKGNAAANNAIYAPVRNSGSEISVTLEGGEKNDTFHGASSSLTSVTYVLDGSGKDVINDYKEGDIVRVAVDSVSADMISEKGSDVIFTFDSKNTVTLKDAATKSISFVGNNNKEFTYGYTLPDGLEYDSKHTAINDVSLNANTDYVQTGGTKANTTYTPVDGAYVAIDLSNNDYLKGGYYAGVKTVNLAGSAAAASLVGSDVANDLYAPSGGSTLYGGDGASASKPSADKLYGNTGVDYFMYKLGDGADVIGDKSKSNSSLEAQDFLILGGGDSSLLTRDQVTITDKKETVTIQYNNDKASKLTITKDDAETPLKILFANSSLKGSGAGGAFNGYDVYGVDTRRFEADASKIGNGTLVITGAGGYSDAADSLKGYTYTGEEGSKLLSIKYTDPNTNSSETLPFADVNVSNISSSLKDINVTADTDTRVNIVGGVSALNVTMGAGGGTVSGGNNDGKALKDTFYSNPEAVRGTEFVIYDSLSAGADVVRNYDASKGDFIHFDTAPDSVKVSKDSVTFSFSGGNKSSVTVYPKTWADSNTNIAIAIGTLAAETYFGWSSSRTSFSDYDVDEFKRDPQWTKPAANTYVFTGVNKSGSSLYGAAYTVQGALIDENPEDFRPDAITINKTATANGTLVFNKGVYVDPNISQFHIQGNKTPANVENITDNEQLGAGSTLKINDIDYILADVDGSVENGYELSYNGFVKTGDSQVVYYGVDTQSAAAGVLGGGKTLLADTPQFTLSGTITDPKESASVTGSKVKGFLDAFTYDSGTSASPAYKISIYGASDTDMTSAHMQLSEDNADNHAGYTITLGTTTTPAQTAQFKLYDGDGSSVNGYELLRTDIADSIGWKLVTGSDDSTSMQSNGSGVWEFTTRGNKASGTPETPLTKVAFTVDSDAKLVAGTDGLPIGISVDYSNVKSGSANSGLTITFADSNFNTSYIHFDSTSTTFGSEASAVHIKGLEVGKTFSVQKDDNTSDIYILGELDGKDNGLELVKSSNMWTFDNGAWIFDNRNIAGNSVNGEETVNAWDSDAAPAVVFTISADAAVPDDGGKPKGITIQTVDGSSKDGSKVGDRVIGIDFRGIFNSTLKSGTDTSMITFATLPTGDIDSSVSIYGFASSTKVGTATVPTFFNIGDSSYYLVDLAGGKGSTDTGAAATLQPHELLRVNDNWIRTADGWKYFESGSPSFTGYADVRIITAGDGDAASAGTVAAALDGSPRGISISGGQIIINSDLGLINTTVDGEGNATIDENNAAASSNVTLNPAQLILASTTVVNELSGLHILGVGPMSDVFTTDTYVSVDVKGKPADSSTGNYRLADLDRDSTNGFELLHNDSVKGWTYNSGEYAMVAPEEGAEAVRTLRTDSGVKRIGSWSFSTATKIGDNAFKFDISEAASLLGQNATLGTPAGVTVTAGTSETAPVSITANSDALNSTHLIFAQNYESSNTALAYFATSAGLHLLGTSFAEGDVVTLPTTVSATSPEDENGTITVAGAQYYRLKELDGDSKTGFELLQYDPDHDNWALTTNAKGVRTWDYVDADSLGGFSMSIASTANLVAVANHAAPAGVTITTATSSANDEGEIVYSIGGQTVSGIDGYATLSFDSGTYKVDSSTMLAGDIKLVTNNVGSKTSLHILGFDTNTTLSVNGEAYRLADLDKNTENGLELIKYNGDWTYYSQAIGDSYASGTWVYSHNAGAATAGKQRVFELTFDSEAGIAYTGEGDAITSHTAVLAADSLGAPEGITISYANSIPTFSFDNTKFNINTVSVEGENAVTLANNFNDHITLAADYSLLGAAGMHIIGFESDTTINVKTSNTDPGSYYLADLNNNADDGYELVYNNPNWHRTATGWSYVDSVDSAEDKTNLAFNIVKEGSILAPVESSATLAESLVGSPQGIILSASQNATYSDTLTISTIKSGTRSMPAVSSNDIKLIDGSFKAGVDGIHIIGLTNGNTFDVPYTLTGSDSGSTEDATIGSKTYTLRELNGDTSTGLELLISNDKGWSFANVTLAGDANKTKGAIGREWSYANTDGSLAFKVVGSDTTGGLTLASSDTGLPLGATVTATAIEGAAEGTYDWTIAFGSSDTTADSTSYIDMSRVSISAATTGPNGIHIKGLLNSDAAVSGSIAYNTDTTFKIGSNNYYLADLDGKAENGYELLKNDTNWHLDANGTWTYKKDNNVLGFTVAKAVGDGSTIDTLKAGDGTTGSEGRPLGISVSNDGKTITISSDGTIAKNLVFSSDSSTANASGLHLLYEAPSEGNNPNSSVTTFQFHFSDNTKQDVTYYVVDADNNAANGLEFLKKNDNWHRYDSGWLYVDNSNNTKFSFFVNSTAPTWDAATGAPVGISVTGNVIEVETKSGITSASQIILFKEDKYGVDTAQDSSGTHISGTFRGGTKNAEGATITRFNGTSDAYLAAATVDGFELSADSVTSYQLYNADADTSNGLELTFNGWLSTSVTVNSVAKDGWRYVKGVNGTGGNNIGAIFVGSAFNQVTVQPESRLGAVSSELSRISVGNNAITINAGEGDSYITDFASDTFMVFGSETTTYGKIGSGSKVLVNTADGSFNFSLKSSGGDAFALSNNGWSKSSDKNTFQYSSTGVAFTISGYMASSGNLDSDNNLIPDFLVNGAAGMKLSNGTLNVSLDNTQINSAGTATISGLQGVEATNVKVKVYTNGVASDYALAAASNNNYTLAATAEAGDGGQLPSNDAWANTGYDIEDLLGGTTGSSTPDTVSELDEIIDVKPLASEAAAAVFNPDAAFTEVGTTDKTLNNVVGTAARHKLRK